MKGGPATALEADKLRAGYPAGTATPGMPVQVLLYGGWPYEAIVTETAAKRARVEFSTRFGGHRERWVYVVELLAPGALQRLRGGGSPGVLIRAAQRAEGR